MSSSSSQSSASSGESDESSCRPDFVRVMLPNVPLDTILVTREADRWDLPYFEYKTSLQDGSRVARCCRDYQNWLGISSKQTFTGAVELLGDVPMQSKRDPGKVGNGKLLVIEYQMHGRVEDLILPRNAEWKDVQFLSSLSADSQSSTLGSDVRRILQVAVRYMRTIANGPSMFLIDPRYRRHWFGKAVNFFLSVLASEGVDATGPVRQEHVSSTSTLLRVNSNIGRYYLKSPALGCQEASISAKLSSLFPRNTPEIVSTCAKLNFFITKGFTHFDLEGKDTRKVVETLAHIQLQSLEHVNSLRDVGCKVRDLEGLLRKINKWANGEGIFSDCHDEVKQMKELLPIITDMCKRLEAFNIPYTLVHGDLALSNATYATDDREDVLLFDWEFACIAHPFCDFHRLHKDLTLDTLTSYLHLWDAFEDYERALEAYRIGWKLGWILKMWSLSDVIESCNLEESSSLRSWVFTILRNLRKSFR